MAVIHFLAAAIQMPQHRGKVDARGIDQRLVRNIEVRADRQQLAADRADLGIELPGIHHRLNEIRQQQHVGI